ncbi:MAG: GNAT family N-acetyltransferase [Bacteroidota bacterium]|nr:GNAT family N-acetyltransferase [Bacteroidota bacterium]
MQIKRISAAEYNLVIGLFNSYRVFYKQQPDLALAESYIKARLQNNESVIFVAMVDEEPAGFTQLYPRLSSVRAAKNWLLNDLYVDGNHRKQGIGEALIKAAMDFARNDGATFVVLETAVDNYTAQSLYEAIGFVKQKSDGSFFTYQIQL